MRPPAWRTAWARRSTCASKPAILARPDSRPGLPGIRGPTLVAVGEADALTPPALASEIAAGMPGALLRTVAGAGHLPQSEQPEQVSAMLLDWIGATRPGLAAS